jgi:hypothetical protein
MVDYPFVLDCFLRPFPVDEENPDAQEGNDNASLVQRAQTLLAAGRFKAIILYQDEGDCWGEIARFPE